MRMIAMSATPELKATILHYYDIEKCKRRSEAVW